MHVSILLLCLLLHGYPRGHANCACGEVVRLGPKLNKADIGRKKRLRQAISGLSKPPPRSCSFSMIRKLIKQTTLGLILNLARGLGLDL